MNINFFAILLYFNFIFAGEAIDQGAEQHNQSVRKIVKLGNAISREMLLNPTVKTVALLDKKGTLVIIPQRASIEEIEAAITPFSANSYRTKYVMLCFRAELSEVKELFRSDCEWPDFFVKAINFQYPKDTISSVLVEHMKPNYKLLAKVLAKIRSITLDKETFDILLTNKLAAKEPLITLKRVNGSLVFCNPRDADVQVVVSYKNVMFNQEEIPLSELNEALKDNIIYFVGEKGAHMDRKSRERALFKPLQPDFQGTSR